MTADRLNSARRSKVSFLQEALHPEGKLRSASKRLAKLVRCACASDARGRTRPCLVGGV